MNCATVSPKSTYSSPLCRQWPKGLSQTSAPGVSRAIVEDHETYHEIDHEKFTIGGSDGCRTRDAAGTPGGPGAGGRRGGPCPFRVRPSGAAQRCHRNGAYRPPGGRRRTGGGTRHPGAARPLFVRRGHRRLRAGPATAGVRSRVRERGQALSGPRRRPAPVDPRGTPVGPTAGVRRALARAGRRGRRPLRRRVLAPLVRRGRPPDRPAPRPAGGHRTQPVRPRPAPGGPGARALAHPRPYPHRRAAERRRRRAAGARGVRRRPARLGGRLRTGRRGQPPAAARPARRPPRTGAGRRPAHRPPRDLRGAVPGRVSGRRDLVAGQRGTGDGGGGSRPRDARRRRAGGRTPPGGGRTARPDGGRGSRPGARLAHRHDPPRRTASGTRGTTGLRPPALTGRGAERLAQHPAADRPPYGGRSDAASRRSRRNGRRTAPAGTGRRGALGRDRAAGRRRSGGARRQTRRRRGVPAPGARRAADAGPPHHGAHRAGIPGVRRRPFVGRDTAADRGDPAAGHAAGPGTGGGGTRHRTGAARRRRARRWTCCAAWTSSWPTTRT